jgi:hypothetical protein
MPKPQILNAVRLEFDTGAVAHTNLSGAAFSGDWLWVVGDETSQVERLRHLDRAGRESLRFGEARSFALSALLELPGAADEEADLEGMAVADGFLWLVGSHGLKRKNIKATGAPADSAKRLAKLSLDGNRRLLACVPIEPAADGAPELVAETKDGRRALRLKGDSESNELMDLLASDPHFGRFMAIPGKDNGFDIEGLAVNGKRLLLGLRGPVLRGWTALLEISVEARRGYLRLLPLDESGTLLRKHFLPLDGLGVRDLHFCGDDLFILAGPTMALDGEIRIYKWAGAKAALAGNREPARFDAVPVETAALPHGRGTNRAEAICNLPPTLSGNEPQWLVLYDAPGPDRLEGERVVFGDLVSYQGSSVTPPAA